MKGSNYKVDRDVLAWIDKKLEKKSDYFTHLSKIDARTLLAIIKRKNYADPAIEKSTFQYLAKANVFTKPARKIFDYDASKSPRARSPYFPIFESLVKSSTPKKKKSPTPKKQKSPTPKSQTPPRSRRSSPEYISLISPSPQSRSRSPSPLPSPLSPLSPRSPPKRKFKLSKPFKRRRSTSAPWIKKFKIHRRPCKRHNAWIHPVTGRCHTSPTRQELELYCKNNR